MIVSLKGCVSQKGPLWAVIEVAGVGYCVHMPAATLEALPTLGGQVVLHTHVVYREEAQTIYGFNSLRERDFFRLLIEKVSGVGPKLALALLSAFPLDTLEAALDNEDVTLLSRCPGVGKKTAERLILELRGKRPLLATSIVTSDANMLAVSYTDAVREALNGLLTLGYSTKEAQVAMERVMVRFPQEAAAFSTERLLKEALGAQGWFEGRIGG